MGVLRHYWRVADVKAWHLVLPIGLILIASAFEGASFALLIPLKDAVAENSFDFLEQSRAFGWLPALVPDGLDPSTRDAYLVLCIAVLIILGRIGKLGFQYTAELVETASNERYRVCLGKETFGRVLTFGRQYFDGQAIGRIDAEIGWSSSVIGLLTAAQEAFRYTVSLLVKVGVMMAISVPLSVAFIVTLPFVQRLIAAVNRAVKRISEEGVEVDRQLRAQTLDILGTIPLVKAVSQEQTASEMYEGVLRQGERVAVRRHRAIVPHRGNHDPPYDAPRSGRVHLRDRGFSAGRTSRFRCSSHHTSAGTSRLQSDQPPQPQLLRGTSSFGGRGRTLFRRRQVHCGLR